VEFFKLHTDRYAITFPSYWQFDVDPHPALLETTRIILNTGPVEDRLSNASQSCVLHRKETILSPFDPRIVESTALTKQEEEAAFPVIRPVSDCVSNG
jgi:hypothetical protein